MFYTQKTPCFQDVHGILTSDTNSEHIIGTKHILNILCWAIIKNVIMNFHLCRLVKAGDGFRGPITRTLCSLAHLWQRDTPRPLFSSFVPWGMSLNCQYSIITSRAAQRALFVQADVRTLPCRSLQLTGPFPPNRKEDHKSQLPPTLIVDHFSTLSSDRPAAEIQMRNNINVLIHSSSIITVLSDQ